MPLDVERIEKPARTLRKFLKKNPKRPSSDEIHRLRTNTRRLEATIAAFGLDRKANERKFLRQMEPIRKRAGKIRDMDVLTGYALTLPPDGEQDCLVRLLEQLGTDRSKSVKRLRARVAQDGPPLRRRLKRTEKKLTKLVGNPGRKRAGSSANAATSPIVVEAMAKALQLSVELKSPPHLDKKNLHPYRLKVKELRYVLQLGDRADRQPFVEKLGEVKDAIGEWHDWGELIAIANEVLEHSALCKLLQRLKAITEEKYEQALALAEDLRRQYLNGRPQRRVKQGPVLVPPAMAAVSRISA